LNRLQKIDYKTIILANQPWQDPFFQPVLSSIIDPACSRKAEKEAWESFDWERPIDVYGAGNFTIFNSISPNNIRQGFCGDCSFLSSISSLAENPDRIKKIFLTHEVNDAGCYALSFFINGEPEVVVVDDRFPFDSDAENWAFSRCNQDP
jgi:hypothetical protein